MSGDVTAVTWPVVVAVCGVVGLGATAWWRIFTTISAAKKEAAAKSEALQKELHSLQLKIANECATKGDVHDEIGRQMKPIYRMLKVLVHKLAPEMNFVVDDKDEP